MVNQSWLVDLLMNMIYNPYNSLKKLRLFYLTVFVGILFVGCEKPENSIGLELQPGDDLLGYFVSDTTTLRASSLKEDSLRTDELTSIMLGNYTDPIFGKTRASAVAQIKLSSSNVVFPEIFEVDSVVLSMVYSGQFYGRPVPQAFQVFKVTEDLYTDTSYFTNYRVQIDETKDLVASQGAIQEISINDFSIVDGDSLQPQLRIPLDIDLGNELMTADPSVLVDNIVFIEYFKGLYIRSLTEQGAVVNYDLVDSDSKLTIFYRDLDDETPDTLSYVFNINSDCVRFTQIEHDYSATVLSGIENAEVDGTELNYVQSAAGIKTIIQFPFLEDYKSFGNITINKAELIIPVVDADISRYSPQSLLFLLYKNENGDNALLPDQNTGSHSIGGNFDESSMFYKYNITRYVQQVLAGEIPDTGIYVVSNSAGVTVNRVVLAGPGSTSDNKMRLELTFSE